MVNPISERRLVENEVISRKPNLKMSQDFDHLNRMASEDGQTDLVPESDPVILFFCECSDEKCKARIKMRKSTYDELHQSKKHFTLVPGHNIPSIERILKSADTYTLVEKFMTPPDNAKEFNATNLNNTEK